MKSIKFLLLLLTMTAFTMVASAQMKLNTSPFHHLLPPEKTSSLMLPASNSITAYRFVLPFAGYSPFTRQISTGIGYGWNKMHWIDSTNSYYVDLSIFGALFVNGNVTPTPYNYTSVGIGVGLLNNLVMVVPSYNLPNTENPSGAFDLKISFGLTFK